MDVCFHKALKTVSLMQNIMLNICVMLLLSFIKTLFPKKGSMSHLCLFVLSIILNVCAILSIIFSQLPFF